MASDPRLIDEARRGRTQAALRAMQLEADMRTDPELRADVFVQRWQAFNRQRRLLLRGHETTQAGKVADSMIGMAKALHRDPQLEALLRSRTIEFGLKSQQGASLSHDLQQWLGRSRSRGIGM